MDGDAEDLLRKRLQTRAASTTTRGLESVRRKKESVMTGQR